MDNTQVAQRLESLEARVAALEPHGSNGPTEAELLRELYQLVERCTPRALALALKEASLDDRTRAFYGAPKTILAKLQAGLSKRSWDDLLTAWKQGEGQEPRSLQVQGLLRQFDGLIEMGMLSYESETGPIDEGKPESGPLGTPADLEKRRQAGRQRLERAQAEAKAWLDKELPG